MYTMVFSYQNDITYEAVFPFDARFLRHWNDRNEEWPRLSLFYLQLLVY